MKKAMLVATSIYALILIALFVFQRNLQYVPMGNIGKLSDYNLEGFEEGFLDTEDDTKILYWFKKPEDENAKVILYLHGNAGNMGDRAHKFDVFAKDGFGIMAISYRGYSKSEGSPSQKGLVNDARAAFKFLLDRGYLARDIVLYGESLGSGVAMQLAAKFDFLAIVLEAPFSSIVSVAQKNYWFVPVKLLLKDKFQSIAIAPKISSPTLIIHGTKDEIVPYAEGQKLYAALKIQKRFITVEEVGHLEFSDNFLLREVNSFLEGVEK